MLYCSNLLHMSFRQLVHVSSRSVSSVGFFFFRVSRVMSQSTLYRYWNRWWCWQMSTVRLKTILVSSVSNQNRCTIRCSITKLSSYRFNLIWSNILWNTLFCYGYTIFCIVTITMYIDNLETFPYRALSCYIEKK